MRALSESISSRAVCLPSWYGDPFTFRMTCAPARDCARTGPSADQMSSQTEMPTRADATVTIPATVPFDSGGPGAKYRCSSNTA